jgi:hypothetical protein
MSSIRASPSPTPLTLPLPQAHFIWYYAWLAIPSAVYAYAHPATTHFAPIPAAVFATSLLYWRNPLRDSWRRTLDMAVVSAGLSHHMYYAVYNPVRTHTPTTTHTYLALIGMSLTSYVVSQYYLYHRLYWPAAYTHASIHLFANIANIVLYYGNHNNNNNNNAATLNDVNIYKNSVY